MPRTRWLTEDEGRAWRNFVHMHLQLSAQLERELATSGLSIQDYGVLANLSDRDDHRARLVELGRDLGWEKSRISHHITRMEERGLVKKSKCPTDNRGWFVTMTAAGRKAIAAAAPDHVDAVRRYFIDLLDKRELETFDKVSARILDALP